MADVLFFKKKNQPARSRMTWSSKGSSEKCGTLFAHSTKVKSCLSAAWQMLVTGSLVWGGEDSRWQSEQFSWYLWSWASSIVTYQPIHQQWQQVQLLIFSVKNAATVDLLWVQCHPGSTTWAFGGRIYGTGSTWDSAGGHQESVCVCVFLTHADVRSYVCTWHFLLQNGKDHSQTEVVSSSDTLTSTFYPQSCTTVTVQQLTLYLLNLMLKMYLWWYLILLSTQIRITVCNCSFLCVANINGHLQQMKYVKG